jgi:hypothetical protein
MLATATIPHINRHFRFAQRDVSGRCAVVPGPDAILLLDRYSGKSGSVTYILQLGLQDSKAKASTKPKLGRRLRNTSKIDVTLAGPRSGSLRDKWKWI